MSLLFGSSRTTYLSPVVMQEKHVSVFNTESRKFYNRKFMRGQTPKSSLMKTNNYSNHCKAWKIISTGWKRVNYIHRCNVSHKKLHFEAHETTTVLKFLGQSSVQTRKMWIGSHPHWEHCIFLPVYSFMTSLTELTTCAVCYSFMFILHVKIK